jgi:hypothetical protein
MNHRSPFEQGAPVWEVLLYVILSLWWFTDNPGTEMVYQHLTSTVEMEWDICTVWVTVPEGAEGLG